MRNASVLEMIWQDIRLTFRTVRKQPGFAATIILTLALAIGGNTTMFTVIHSVLLKPLAYPDSDALVRVSGSATPLRFAEMKASARSFSGLGAFTGEESPTLSGSGQGEPEVLKGVRVSADFMRILGVRPLLGREFRSAEDSREAPKVVMISAELWQRRFASDPQIQGKTVILAGSPSTIVGVLPPRFAFPYPGMSVWMTTPTEWPLMAAKSRVLSPFLNLFGRLKPGLSIEQANAEAKVIHGRYASAHPTMLDAKPKRPENITALKDDLVIDVRSMLWMLFGAVGFVLLIACANIASLLLARATSRQRETAVRSALGAARIRLIRQFIVESVLLSLSGGFMGVLVAAYSLHALANMTAFELPRAQEIHLDWMVLAFAAAVSIATGVLFGLAPAIAASRPDLITVLRVNGVTGTQSKSIRGVLLVTQVALSVVLLIGTALLIESVGRLRNVPLGFNASNILTASISPAPLRYDTDEKRALFFERLVDQIRSSPGIRSAAAAMFLPMMGYAGSPVQDAAQPLLRLNERPIATLLVVTPGYFQTLGIPLLRGMDFSERDKGDSERVAIIDEAFARRFWPMYPRAKDPIGQHIWVGGVNPNPARIIGIVPTVHQTLENTGWPQTVYLAFEQNPQSFAMLAVKVESNPLAFASTLRAAVQSVDKNQSISELKSMDDLVDNQLGQRRFLAILLGSFAAMALLLVLMGIYGLVSYSVTERNQEIGVRRALGAQQADILRLVVGQSFRLTLVGVGLGIAGALGLTGLMRKLLFNISATDPATFVIVALLFLFVALVSSFIPAGRATRIDAATALRI